MAKFRVDRFTSEGGKGTRLYDPNEEDKNKDKDKSKDKDKDKNKGKGNKKTAAARSALIKLAAALPVNSEDRRVLLACIAEDDG
jgi:hypothetical protein